MMYPHTITITRASAPTFNATTGNPSAQGKSVIYSGRCFRQDAPRGLMTAGTGDEARQATEVCYLPRGTSCVQEDDRFDVGDFRGRVTERTHARGRFYTKLTLLRDDKV